MYMCGECLGNGIKKMLGETKRSCYGSKTPTEGRMSGAWLSQSRHRGWFTRSMKFGLLCCFSGLRVERPAGDHRGVETSERAGHH